MFFERRTQIRFFLWGLVLLGFVAGLVRAAARWQVEARNRSVEICLDYLEVEKAAAAIGMPVQDALRRFKEAGVTSIAVTEDTIGSLADNHRLNFLSSPIDPNTCVLGPLPANDIGLPTLQHVVRVAKYKVNNQTFEDGKNFLITQPFHIVRSVGVGLEPLTVEPVKEKGLAVVGRVSNYNGVQPRGIEWTLQQLQKQGVKTVIFSGDDVLGFKGFVTDDPKRPNITTTETAFRNFNLRFGVVEFGKQKGSEILAKAVPERVIRVHTVTGAEMATATQDTNVQRFQLAAQERNIRLLYVRLFLDERDPLTENIKYITAIVKGLEQSGLKPGAAQGYAPLSTPLWVKGLIGLAIAAAWLLLCDSVTYLFAGTAGRPVALIAFAGAIQLLGLPLSGMTGAKYAALMAGCLFPSLAVLHRDYLRPEHGKPPVPAALLRLLMMCAITGVGIACIIGLLSDRLFLIKSEAFVGVKATLIVPLLLVVLFYGLALRANENRTFGQALQETTRRLLDVIYKPVLIGPVLLSMVALGFVALIWMRSGNDPGVGVSSLELKLRALLDQLLIVRPRFKEMFGHAVMLLGLLFAVAGRRLWALPLILVGTVGQASLLNTFCHLHTPLPVSLWRAVLGIVLGAIPALLLYALLARRIK